MNIYIYIVTLSVTVFLKMYITIGLHIIIGIGGRCGGIANHPRCTPKNIIRHNINIWLRVLYLRPVRLSNENI